jgi:hypothetical protein
MVRVDLLTAETGFHEACACEVVMESINQVSRRLESATRAMNLSLRAAAPNQEVVRFELHARRLDLRRASRD